MPILVSGGAGYIGSHAACALLEAGERPVALDNLSTGHRAAAPKDAKLYVGDLRDRGFLRRVFAENDIEAVFHFAARSLVGESMQKPLLYFDNNVAGMLALLEQMAESSVDKIIFSSTCAVYGDSGKEALDETCPVAPQSAYGESKAIMENMMKWVAMAGKISYVSLRYFNAAGASRSLPIGEDHRPETHLVPLALKSALGQLPQINIFGADYDTPDGTAIRDYIHVEDIAAAHLKALNYLRAGGKSAIFNLGRGTGYSVRQIIDICRAVTGLDIKTACAARRPGDPPRLVAGGAKAEKELGWRPKRAIEDIIATAWEWHKKRPGGYG
ncbi:MAG: UDP-glucose 4-epimerase GalE [Acidaminococcales bacterium]|jgi:UDP-glucose 4-epimerase|nr:UDP-glucose 4-epimerase GalE [Acidaminococcales bacterium]